MKPPKALTLIVFFCMGLAFAVFGIAMGEKAYLPAIVSVAMGALWMYVIMTCKIKL